MSAQPFIFKRAARQGLSLLIGLSGGTGSGKTFTAMRLASGLAQGKPFAVIDTEAGRAKHYADRFEFDHGDLKPPFTPDAYEQAIFAADHAGYPVVVVDSASHEWAGEGGILEWQEAELDRMAGNDWDKRERVKMAAWIKPKMSHKKMVQRLLQLRAHLILCFRAEEKIEMKRNDKGKMEAVPKFSRTGLDGWIPICEKSLPFELTVSFLLTNDAPGYPKPIKLEEQHKAFFPLDQPINEKTGELLGVWAAGGVHPEETVRKLFDEYTTCASTNQFTSLELRRKEMWDKLSATHKQKLKVVSEAARAKLKRVPPSDDSWIAEFRTHKSIGELDNAMVYCATSYSEFSLEVPLPVEDAFNLKREELLENEGKAE